MFAFAFAIYARVRIASAQLGQQADAQLKNYLSNNAISQYVNSCLDSVADDVILTAAMQGGVHNNSGDRYIEY
jgi:hypothetical protein